MLIARSTLCQLAITVAIAAIPKLVGGLVLVGNTFSLLLLLLLPNSCTFCPV